jgi:FAD:protein FMN transferase
MRRRRSLAAWESRGLGVIVALVLALAGCEAAPEEGEAESVAPVEIGTAECAACGMVVREQPAPRGQLVHRDGTHQHFCALADLAHYAQTPSPHGGADHIFVEALDPSAEPAAIDASPRDWVDAAEASYVVGVERPRVMGEPALAYGSRAEAEQVAARLGGRVVSWKELSEHLTGTSAEGPAPATRRVIVTREAVKMGTRFELKVVADNEAAADAAIDAAFEEVDRVEALLSEWREDSEISRVNSRAGQGPVAVGPELFEVVERAQQIAEMTDGAFDLTFASCGDLWSVSDKRVPDEATIAECKPRIDYQQIALDRGERTIALEESHTRIGIAAIGKGYGVDRAAQVLVERGVEHFMVDGGGDIRARGAHPKRPWRVGVAHPRQRDKLLASVPIGDAAVVTSGDYEHFFERDGQRYHHIIDPRTARPARASVAATVRAANATDADALATAFFVLGPERAVEIADDLPGVEALVVGADLDIHTSAGFDGVMESSAP